MPWPVKSLFRAAVPFALAWVLSGCTGWIEDRVDTATRAIDCAVLASAEVPATGQSAHCQHHPAAQG